MKVVIHESEKLDSIIAAEIADLIRAKAACGQSCVLGLATGATPIGLYGELCRLHRNEGLSFKNVITFNLDEYFFIRSNDPQSYHEYMHQFLLDHIDITARNIHIPDGSIGIEQVDDYCEEYEQRIRDAGGIDFQLLGIGANAHVGFNEPGSAFDSRTRLVVLDQRTIRDNAQYFLNPDAIPRHAISMGLGTILESRRIVLLALGPKKAEAVSRAINGPVTSGCPASVLQRHPDVRVFLDNQAACLLSTIDPSLVTATDSLISASSIA